jgi:hypothetical protein
VTDGPIHREVVAFFDEFVEVFLTFDGSRIAWRYLVPYLAMHADGSTELFTSDAAVAEYFQRIVDEYRAGGCTACRYRELEVVPVGGNAALGTVTWDLLRADGTVLTSWRESYNLTRSAGRLKAFVSVDHAG